MSVSQMSLMNGFVFEKFMSLFEGPVTRDQFHSSAPATSPQGLAEIDRYRDGRMVTIHIRENQVYSYKTAMHQFVSSFEHHYDWAGSHDACI